MWAIIESANGLARSRRNGGYLKEWIRRCTNLSSYEVAQKSAESDECAGNTEGARAKERREKQSSQQWFPSLWHPRQRLGNKRLSKGIGIVSL